MVDKIKELDGADISLVYIKNGKPECVIHGSLNKVSEEGYWRCISSYAICRAGCKEKRDSNT